ncbi:MAG: Fibronectin type domain, partial [Frankiaceae bacterium]|nr:Fibronectin type domain [Frankiaceae bacterium]
SVTSVTMPSCTTYDGFVNDDAATPAPFTFTIDMTPPTADITSVNSGLASIDAAHVKSVPLAGTAAADTKSVALTVKSSASPSPRFVTTNVVAGNPATWSASPDLSSLQDGTLTITAVATDQAGNKTTPAAKVTTPMSAHPTKPLAYKVTAGDASAKLAWSPPTQTGGHPITGYSVTAKDTTAGTAPSSTSVPCAGTTCPSAYTLTGLVDGDSYDVSLAATTDVGKGAPATATVRPRAATSLTEKASAKVVSAGKSITLSGRLMRTSTGSGLAKVTLAITPKFDNGKSGKKLTAVTDIFGVWYASVRPTQNATYVVSYAGDAGNLPARAKARTKVRVRIAFTSPNSGSVGSPVVLQGRVSPAKAGSWVTILRRTSSGNTVLGKVRLSRASTWTFTLTLPRGTTKVFARIGATAGNLGNRTSLLTLTRH